MIFKLYNCDIGVDVDGTRYNFDHVQEVQIEDNERNRLTRGANASNKIGLVYKDGLKDPKRITIPIMNMSVALKALLDQIYNDQTRVTLFIIDRDNGGSKMGKNAVLSNLPQQLQLDETAEAMNVSLEFETFDLVEVHKE